MGTTSSFFCGRRRDGHSHPQNNDISSLDRCDVESHPIPRPTTISTPPPIHIDNEDNVCAPTGPLSAQHCTCHEQFANQPLKDILQSYEDLVANNHVGKDIFIPSDRPLIHVFQTGPLSCNTIIIADPVTKDAILVDPGGTTVNDAGGTRKHRVKQVPITDKLADLGLNITKIFITHGHFDHILGLGSVREMYPAAKVYMHKDDRLIFQFLPFQLSMMQLRIPRSEIERIGQPDVFFDNSHEITRDIGLFGGKIIHTPGHTEGSVCIYFENAGLLLSGDTLFRGAVGRTDLNGGNATDLKRSILSKLYQLPDHTNVIPGHGPRTMIGQEKRNNASIKEDDAIPE